MQFQEFLNSLCYDAAFLTQPVLVGQRGLRQAVGCVMYEDQTAPTETRHLPFRCLDLDWMSDLLTGVSATFPRYFKYGKNFVIKLPQNGDIHISFQTIQGK